MGMMTKFLIIEDNDEVVEAVSMVLQLRWPNAGIVSTNKGGKGITMAETEAPDIIILDLGLPDISGFEVLKSIRLFSNVPIVILSVRGEEADVFKGLELGADDYIIKPFRQLELLARLKALTRRQRQCEHEQPLINCGSLNLNIAERIFSRGEKQIKLTRTECAILAHLMENSNNTVSHNSLAEALWGNDYPDSTDNIKVHVSRLRQKVELNPSHPHFIITKPGLGYLFNSD